MLSAAGRPFTPQHMQGFASVAHILTVIIPRDREAAEGGGGVINRCEVPSVELQS